MGGGNPAVKRNPPKPNGLAKDQIVFGDKLSGTCKPEQGTEVAIRGNVKDRAVTFEHATENEGIVTFHATPTAPLAGTVGSGCGWPATGTGGAVPVVSCATLLGTPPMIEATSLPCPPVSVMVALLVTTPPWATLLKFAPLMSSMTPLPSLSSMSLGSSWVLVQTWLWQVMHVLVDGMPAKCELSTEV